MHSFALVVCILSVLGSRHLCAFTLPSYSPKGRPAGLTISRNDKPWSSSISELHMASDYVIESNGNVHKLKFEVAGKEMSFETGRIGRQASGSVMAQTKDTIVYSTVCAERESSPVDFTPLRVDFFARYSAVGQTVGAFHRRDSRGDDTEILVARLIDRPLRPMIQEGWQHETQVLSWVLSYDKQHTPDTLSICSASAAMMVSAVPMHKPIAGVEVGIIDNQIKVNPTKEEMKQSILKLTLAGTKDGILMIEGVADFLPEEIMIDALRQGHTAIGVICDAIDAFSKLGGSKEKKLDTLRVTPSELLDKMDREYGDDMQKALSIGDKQKRGKACAEVEKMIQKTFAIPVGAVLPTPSPVAATDKGAAVPANNPTNPDDKLTVAETEGDEDGGASSPVVEVKSSEDVVLEEDEASEINTAAVAGSIPATAPIVSDDIATYDPLDVKIATKKLLVRRMRKMVLTTGKRSDGRGVEDVRPISIDTSLLPNAHGSALFTRGETQTIATATLGSKAMEQKVETIDEMTTKRFYLQYRFPPSSVGEVGRVGGVNRREVGHGNLAERALMACLPEPEEFPYSIRAESLITESCGSSSMATVCGCCLAMLDAGVPLKSSVAGVAMGLILGENEGDEPVILTDILGLEDALGTMDFKVAGDDLGISTFQLDIKSEGLTLKILEDALMQAKRGRLAILDTMKQSLANPRELKNTIPKIVPMTVPPESLGKIIGPKGKTVQSLIEEHELININLEDNGNVQIEGYDMENIKKCQDVIRKIVSDMKEDGGGRRGGRDKKEKVELGPPPEIGIVYKDCEIKGIHNFGIFVEILPGYEGLIHVSELDTKKVNANDIPNLYKVGEKLDVKFLGKNDKGQMRLSRRAVLMRSEPTPASVASGAGTSSASSASAEDAYSS